MAEQLSLTGPTAKAKPKTKPKAKAETTDKTTAKTKPKAKAKTTDKTTAKTTVPAVPKLVSEPKIKAPRKPRRRAKTVGQALDRAHKQRKCASDILRKEVARLYREYKRVYRETLKKRDLYVRAKAREDNARSKARKSKGISSRCVLANLTLAAKGRLRTFRESNSRLKVLERKLGAVRKQQEKAWKKSYQAMDDKIQTSQDAKRRILNLSQISNSDLVREFREAARLAGPGAADMYHKHFNLVAAEMDKRGLQG